jgi:hypothetical protein
VPWFLTLQGPTHRTNESTVYQLADAVDIQKLQMQFVQEAAMGGVVSVPAVIGGNLKPVMLYVRPAAWGLWTMYELTDEERTDLGNTFMNALSQAIRQQQGAPTAHQNNLPSSPSR